MKKIWMVLSALLCVCFAPSVWAQTYPAMDAFSGSGPLSSSWSQVEDTGQTTFVALVRSNGMAVPATAASKSLAMYTGAAFSDDQYAQAVFVAHVGSVDPPWTGGHTGPCVEMNSVGTGFCYLGDLGKIIGFYYGVYAYDPSINCPVPASGDTIRLSLAANIFTCTDLTTGVSTSGARSTNFYVAGTHSPAMMVDQRTSSAYALSGFQADCIPTCGITVSQVAAPVFSPPPGSYSAAQLVTISTATSGAIIHYTIDGSTPTTSSATYSAPISVSSTETVKALAVMNGFSNSSVAAAAYTITGGGTSGTVGNVWYVRKDGGTRYGPNRTNGQCDGQGDSPYSGSGVNQHCAFNDVRYLWQDGNYDNGQNQGWIIAGGDTVFIRGSIADGITYRIGWNNKDGAYEAATDTYWGKPGDPYGSGIPVPPSGTASQHTRILGENYGLCHSQTARTQLHGGFGVNSIVNLQGASYVDLQCLDITDFSACGRSSQSYGCNTNPGSLDDYAGSGIVQDNNTTHLTVTDVRIHGMAGGGLFGPNGDGNVYSYIDIVGNANAGWNADNGTVGRGSALMQNFSISWNGCAEEYPIVHTLPYSDCTDDNVGGYGDGFGTATINGTVPWNVTFDTGTVSYNTQDGLDALHLVGPGSSMTISRVKAYGNMGQQIKVGGAGGSAINNVIVTNCNAMRAAIPGTPGGYNSRLTDYCRAADTGIYMATQDGSTTRFDFNTVYSATATTVQIGCGGTCTAGTNLIDFRDNVILGFLNSTANGYPSGTDDYANPIYIDGTNAFTNSGSKYDHNLTFHAKSTWSCPNNSLLETNALCADPGLADETWHIYGIGDMSPSSSSSIVVGTGIAIPGITTSVDGHTRNDPPTIGAYE